MFLRCRDGGDPGAGAGPGRGGRPAEPRGPDRVQHRLHAQTLQDRRRDRMALHQQGNNSTGEIILCPCQCQVEGTKIISMTLNNSNELVLHTSYLPFNMV